MIIFTLICACLRAEDGIGKEKPEEETEVS